MTKHPNNTNNYYEGLVEKGPTIEEIDRCKLRKVSFVLIRYKVRKLEVIEFER